MSEREGFYRGWDAAVQLVFNVAVNPKLAEPEPDQAKALRYLAEEMFRIRDEVADSALGKVA